MSDDNLKGCARGLVGATNKWRIKRLVVNGEEQWWVENGERNIALAMSREDAEGIIEAHNLQNFGDDRFFTFIRQQEGRAMKLLNTPIDALELTVRSSNCLDGDGVKTIGDLIRKTESELLSIKNLGKKSFSEIKYKLNILGLSFNLPYHSVLENMVGSVGDIDMLYTELVYKLKEENKELRMRMLWHPVSEKPKEDGEYLCTDHIGMIEILLFEMGKWHYFNDTKVVWIPFPKDRYPVSWMPLPKPETVCEATIEEEAEVAEENEIEG